MTTLDMLMRVGVLAGTVVVVIVNDPAMSHTQVAVVHIRVAVSHIPVAHRPITSPHHVDAAMATRM